MRNIPAAAVGLAVLLLAAPASAVPIILADIPFGMGHACLGPNEPCDEVIPTGVGNHIFGVEGSILFEGMNYTPSTVPFINWADAGNDVDFAAVVGYITNAVADDYTAQVTLAPFGGGGGFSGDDIQLFGTDFAGYTITRIGLQFISMSITDTVDGWEASENLRLLVEGEAMAAVPEPSTLLLVCAGAGLLLRRRFRR